MKTIATLVNYTRKSFIKLAPGNVLWQELYLSVFSSLAAV